MAVPRIFTGPLPGVPRPLNDGPHRAPRAVSSETAMLYAFRKKMLVFEPLRVTPFSEIVELFLNLVQTVFVMRRHCQTELLIDTRLAVAIR